MSTNLEFNVSFFDFLLNSFGYVWALPLFKELLPNIAMSRHEMCLEYVYVLIIDKTTSLGRLRPKTSTSYLVVGQFVFPALPGSQMEWYPK